jgi:hypothetical protein
MGPSDPGVSVGTYGFNGPKWMHCIPLYSLYHMGPIVCHDTKPYVMTKNKLMYLNIFIIFIKKSMLGYYQCKLIENKNGNIIII